MKMKRLIAVLLAVVLALGLIPLTSIGGGVAYAEEDPPRLTQFTINSGAEILAKKAFQGIAKKGVVATVNACELTQESPKSTDGKIRLGKIEIYYTPQYTADVDISVGTQITSGYSFALDELPEESTKDTFTKLNINSDGTYDQAFYYYNDTTYFYYVKLIRGGKTSDTTAPVLTYSGFYRSGNTAKVLFSSDEAGKYYYSYGDENSSPEVDTSGDGYVLDAGENSLSLEGLTEGAKVVRIVAVDSAGNKMETPLEITLPAEAGTQWPQISNLTFANGSWNPSGVTLFDQVSSNTFAFNNSNVSIKNYDELQTVSGKSDSDTEKYYLAGEIKFAYGDALLYASVSTNLKKADYGVEISNGNMEGSTMSTLPASISLSSGNAEAQMITRKVTDASGNTVTHYYYYKVQVVGNNLLASYPNTWTLNEAGDTFTYKPGKYLSNYANWDTTNQVLPTWGTSIDKTMLNFTGGSDTFTLTNSVGTTKTYTVKLDMPWQLSVPGDPGYDLSFIKSNDTVLQSALVLKNNKALTVTKEAEVGSTITVAIKPYGDNLDKVIDTITLTSADGKTTFSASDIPITINGNTFSFTMPNKNVKVASVTFKEDTSPRYTISTTASKFRSDNGDMGTVKVADANGAEIGDAHAGNNITVTATPVEHGAYTFQFERWEAEGITLTDEQKANATITFEMPAGNVSLNAVFKKVGAELTFSANPESALTRVELGNQVGVYMSLDFATTKTDTVKPGAKIIVRATGQDQFVLDSYTVTDQGNNTIDYTREGWSDCVFTVPEGATSVHVTANYRAKQFSKITTAVNDTAMGSVTATVNDTPISAAVTEGEAVTLTATPKFRYKFNSWTVAYADGSSVDFTLTSEADTPNIATFTVPTNGKDIMITANFERDLTQNSTACEMRSVGLYNGTTKIGSLSKSGTNYTITLPADTDTDKLGEMLLKLTASDYATITKSGDTEAKDWASGQPCGMTLDTPATFVVTAEDGTTTKTYTITIKQEAAPNAPTLSAGSATRNGKTGVTVTFTSSEAGSYYYKLVTKGAAASTIDTTGSGDSASVGSNTITLTNLTEDARDIYIVVKNANSVVSDALKVEIPAYSSGSTGGETTDEGAYTITYSGPKGGKLVPSRTKADKGDTITVTISPDSGYQMVAGSMTYTLAVSGGTTTKITGNQFTMPEGDVTLSCQWETASMTASGITAFSINGVSAAVNNTTNVITITLPRGTDVTKLTPVISTSGVKSLSPASGKTVDFTNSVTYTATMDDGTVKTYTVTVYVDKGSLADQFWDKLTDFYNQTPWWEYAKTQQSTSKYPKYW